MAEFNIPQFLQNHSTDEVHNKMKSILPADLDVSEGGHAWNMTRPTALVVAEVCEFVLPEVVRLIFPEWSYGEFLDGHARARSITRRAATAASGDLTITGTPNTVIPAGSLFATAAVNEEPSVDYETLEEITIPESGIATVRIQCTQTGTIGNTPANTIVLVGGRINGITAVTNENEITGGTEEEDDESVIERIVSYDRSQGDSFTGSVADYKRWATSVAGVGEATVIPANDSSGLVTIILTDSNGSAANEALCEAVYNYIMSPNNEGERLAPVNAYLSVIAPATIEVGVSAVIEIESTTTIEAVKAAFLAKLETYLPVALDEGEIKYSRVAAALSATEGVYDFNDIQIGIKDGETITYGTANIPIYEAMLPTIKEENLTLTVGSVHGSNTSIGSGSNSGTGAGAVVVRYATLDASGKLSADQIPSSLDDVIEGYYHDEKFYSDEAYTEEITGETGKLYLDIATNAQYRYDGIAYVNINAGSVQSMTSTEIEEVYKES